MALSLPPLVISKALEGQGHPIFGSKRLFIFWGTQPAELVAGKAAGVESSQTTAWISLVHSKWLILLNIIQSWWRKARHIYIFSAMAASSWLPLLYGGIVLDASNIIFQSLQKKVTTDHSFASSWLTDICTDISSMFKKHWYQCLALIFSFNPR